MNKYFITILLAILFASYISADNREQQLRKKIERLDSAFPSLRMNKKKLENRLEVIRYYQELDSLLTKSNSQKSLQLKDCKPYKSIEFLLSEDSEVFDRDYPQDNLSIPNPLKYHYETIKMISDLKKRIVATEQTVVELSDNYGKDMLKSGQVIDIKSAIAEKIEKDMVYMDELISKIKNRDLSSLSKQQFQYFKPGLTERYNAFLKFFE